MADRPNIRDVKFHIDQCVVTDRGVNGSAQLRGGAAKKPTAANAASSDCEFPVLAAPPCIAASNRPKKTGTEFLLPVSPLAL